MKLFILCATFIFLVILIDKADSAYKFFNCNPTKQVIGGKTIYKSGDGKYKYELSFSNKLSDSSNKDKEESDLVIKEAYEGKKGFNYPPGNTIILGKTVRLDSQGNPGKGNLNLAIQTNGQRSTNFAGAHGPENFFNDSGNACDALQLSLTHIPPQTAVLKAI